MPGQSILTGIVQPTFVNEGNNNAAVNQGAFLDQGVSAVSITPTVGAATITGQAPIITVGDFHFVTPSVGALAITGTTVVPTVTASFYISPTVGAAAITGQAPTVTLQILITPSVATSLVITGQTPSVTAGGSRSITPGVGALAITGQAPTVTATDAATQLGLAVGDGIDCYEGLVHWRAGMGIGGIDAILYTGP